MFTSSDFASAIVAHGSSVAGFIDSKVLLEDENMWIKEKYYKDFPHLKNQIGFGFSQNELNNFPEMKLSW